MSEPEAKTQEQADSDVYEENLGCEGRAAWLAAIVIILLLVLTTTTAAQDVNCPRPRPAPYTIALPLVQNQQQPDAWCMSIGCVKTPTPDAQCHGIGCTR